MEALLQTLSPDQFQHTRLGFPRPEKFELVQQKGVYPYDYFDSFEKFNETDLPPRERFYNKLTDGSITKEQYRHAQMYGLPLDVPQCVHISTFILKVMCSC